MENCKTKKCGMHSQSTDYSPEVFEKIKDHPCYSPEAHHFYARMHVAVAPACNIQCNYCNRKYDCANESRPGVVSELLTPEEALKKVMVVAMAIPQTTVVGIAGPGDPLANPKRTFKTFELLKEKAPDIKLCLSTNGLTLVDYVPKIKELGIDHVTITINAVSPGTAAKIYPWIFFNHKRYRGYDAAKILLERQYEGLQACVENGILVKVNTVYIPEINGDEILDLSSKIKNMGAFLHNIMPYVEGEGTYYNTIGVKPPTEIQLKEVQEKCEGSMSLMRHCRQCRADAIGLLGEDRGQEFTLDKINIAPINYDPEYRKSFHMEIEKKRNIQISKSNVMWNKLKISKEENTTEDKVLVAVASNGGMVVNEHFGKAKEFLIYEVSRGGYKLIHHRKVKSYCHTSTSCLSGEDILKDTLSKLSDCKAVIAAKIGFEPKDVLEANGIDCVEEFCYLSIPEALYKYYKKYVLKQVVEV